MGQGYECERDVHVEAELEAGEYLLYVEVEWAQDCVREFVVSCYAGQSVALCELPCLNSGSGGGCGASGNINNNSVVVGVSGGGGK